ncbi:hypothetical protein AAVH_25561 [Aphelenchoides avenae]|nr:hypothetical protein AAVH_25561 [Aphelenchus avenae]
MTGRRSSNTARRSSTNKRLSFVDKLYACKKCDACFTRRSHLDIHMRTHIDEARRLSAIEAELRQEDASSPAVPNDAKPSTNQESVKRRSLPHDDLVSFKKARKSLAQDSVNVPKSGPVKAIAKRIGSASLSSDWRYAKLNLSQRTKTIQGAAVAVYA